MKIKRMATTIAASLMVLSTVACSSSQGDGKSAVATDKGASPSDKVTIRMAFRSDELTDQNIADFSKEFPSINLVRVDPDYNKLMVMIASGNAPDIMKVSGATQLPGFVSKGLAKDLTSYFEKSKAFPKDDVLPINDLFRFDGKEQGKGPIYGFVKDWSPDFTLFYNKKLFEAANLPFPSQTEPLTWNQLLDISKKLTKQENGKVSQYGLGFYLGQTAANQSLVTLQLAELGKSPYVDGFNKADLTTPEAKSVLNFWVNAVKANVGPNPLNLDNRNPRDLFLEDKVGILITGYWYSGVMRGNDNIKDRLNDFGVAPAPVMDQGIRMSPSNGAVGAIISKDTKHPDEAWKVFEWFFSGKPADDRAKTGFGLPAFKSKMSLLPNSTEWDKNLYNFVNQEIKYANKYLPFNPYLTGNAFDGLLDKYMSPVYFDKDTVDDAAQKVSQELNLLITEGKQISGVQ